MASSVSGLLPPPSPRSVGRPDCGDDEGSRPGGRARERFEGEGPERGGRGRTNPARAGWIGDDREGGEKGEEVLGPGAEGSEVGRGKAVETFFGVACDVEGCGGPSGMETEGIELGSVRDNAAKRADPEGYMSAGVGRSSERGAGRMRGRAEKAVPEQPGAEHSAALLCPRGVSGSHRAESGESDSPSRSSSRVAENDPNSLNMSPCSFASLTELSPALTLELLPSCRLIAEVALAPA